ncbi:hypothetical protein ACIGXA_39745 [Streptomyces fildesensis]|uniref:Uncharacterized protein n=1 Tax=Streptomyces fildesensis TaxID=375757 RepID=A0ABW8CJP6_9ACTN
MAAIRGCSVGDVVTWLLERAVGEPSASGALSYLKPGEIAVFGAYRGTRTSAVLDRTNRGMLITSGPLSGQRFGSPSGAARAVVEILNPNRQHSEQNGLTFWRVEDGRKIKDLLP